jgi:hypothetical protein
VPLIIAGRRGGYSPHLFGTCYSGHDAIADMAVRDHCEIMKLFSRKLDVALLPLQSIILAIWLEGIWTAKWVYPHCDYPLFGWPLPNREFSEVSSLEWFVDWQNYAVDIIVYAVISVIFVCIFREVFYRFRKSLNAIFFAMLAIIIISIFFGANLYHPISIETLYRHERLQMVGMSHGGIGNYGTCSDAAGT